MAASDVAVLTAKLDATQSDLALARGKIEKGDLANTADAAVREA
jgi:hypothetical protein